MGVFEKNRVNLESVTESFNLSSPFGRMLVSILGSLAEMEKDIISSRTKSGLRAARARGVRLGAKKQYDAKIMHKMSLEGLSGREIANIVGCSSSTVTRLLKSST